MNPDSLLTLLTAMGRTGYLDRSGGYGVVRVIERLNQKTSTGLTFAQVWDPVNNWNQAWEVAAWLLNQRPDGEFTWFEIVSRSVYAMRNDDVNDPVPIFRYEHNGTPTGLREAVIKAACMVAESMRCAE